MFRSFFVLTILAGLFAAGPALAAASVNDDAVAVVIGNRSYKSTRIPAVTYAHNDAAAVKRYLMDVLGYREGNIIYLKDATQAEMQSAFGNNVTHKGKLWRIVRKGVSDVTVFYSGHGVPGLKDKRGYLLPVDGDPNSPEINGYPVDVLQMNLSQLGARSVAVYIDACFSGSSYAGSLVRSTSGITIIPRLPPVPEGMVVLTAAKADQVASWDEKNKHGLFTHHLLSALYGEADTKRYGDGNGWITAKEVKIYLDREMTNAARRQYGREQDASVRGEEATMLGPVPKDARPKIAPALAALSSATEAVSTAGFYEGVAAYDRGDFKTALREFRVSAVQGDARAQYNLGVMYRIGQGVTQDYQEAERWYRNASEHGHAGAQFSLGLMYQEGLIGKMYVKGQGIKRNYVKAYKWFNIAASNGHAKSKENMSAIEKKMTSDDIFKARKLAREWMRSQPNVSQGLDYSQRKSFEKAMVRACVQKQKSRAVNSGFEDWQMEEYCDCSARNVSSKVQISDLVHMTKKRSYNRRTRDLLEISAQKCLDELMGKWGIK
jgi:hypothetical protein